MDDIQTSCSEALMRSPRCFFTAPTKFRPGALSKACTVSLTSSAGVFASTNNRNDASSSVTEPILFFKPTVSWLGISGSTSSSGGNSTRTLSRLETRTTEARVNLEVHGCTGFWWCCEKVRIYAIATKHGNEDWKSEIDAPRKIANRTSQCRAATRVFATPEKGSSDPQVHSK